MQRPKTIQAVKDFKYKEKPKEIIAPKPIPEPVKKVPEQEETKIVGLNQFEEGHFSIKEQLNLDEIEDVGENDDETTDEIPPEVFFLCAFFLIIIFSLMFFYFYKELR